MLPKKAAPKPKPQPRRGAAATAASSSTSAPSAESQETPAGSNVLAPAITNRPREETLFIQDKSDDEEETAGPFIIDDDTPMIDVPLKIALEDDNVSNPEDDDKQAENSDDDDDPVVQSYDIIVNDKLKDMLYLFQYPVRSKDQPYTAAEGLAPHDARWKVKSGLVELDIPTNINKNFDQQKGIHWGQVMHKAKMERNMLNFSRTSGGKAAGTGPKRRRRADEEDDSEDDNTSTPTYVQEMDFEEAKRKDRVLNRQRLGAKMQPSDTNYFVAVWRGDKLHLTKLQDTLQLRPQFPHVDLALEQDKAGLKAARELNNPTPARPQEARAVNLTVKGGDLKPGESRSPFGDQLSKDLRKEEDEEWREIDWVDQDMDEAWMMYENLFKQEPRQLQSVFSKQEYLKWCSAPRLEPVNPLKPSFKKIPVKKEKS